ncbi:MAG: hypothetical protein COW16_10195 [Sphingomonadales bacterium CG12_big_fil_rev_8_21_14_0_65_65_10]|jgi:hypothetical protein|uniref:Uncharacterized protein n=1 Tax=Blastomonas marina TaxID=1867408 RepID=A0ABQ1FDH4_9SPHN|nr:hypothetical protein [Blastomonas marina]PIW54670.1 MAG: hypothetical protein COW16_10195 [Sphingomonadales bacterium CG12_big_fil_rev_8_21_14_0_65_65_10]WPZ05214.1 hypothetical protein T8S45_06670 [Blastomonas marina]GGA06743.1 hypothetical protein GCM10010923_15810 [Blastomonas marina]
MKPQMAEKDTLSHIDYGEKIDADDPKLLRNQVSATDGRIVIVSAFGCSLVLNWSFGADGVHVQVVLETPVGSVTIIDTTLNASKPSITLGGSIDSFKAEATITFDFSNLELSGTGEVCAPIVGCKKGSFSIKV